LFHTGWMPETEQLTPEEVLSVIAAEPKVWVRLAAVVDSGVWKQHIMKMTAGEAPPSWVEQRWEYSTSVFCSVVRKGSVVAGWMKRKKMVIGRYRILLPEIQRPVTWTSTPSFGRTLDGHLPWPTFGGDLASQSMSQFGHPHGTLVANGQPSFVSFDVAAASFFKLPRQPGGGLTNSGPSFRRQDRRGRIIAVRITASEVRVEVDGQSIAGSIVELAGDDPGPYHRVNRGGRRSVLFETPDGLPSGAWIALRSGDALLDARFLTAPYTRSGEPGVEVEIEPATQLETLVAGSEGPVVEFKEGYPGDSDEAKRTVMKTVAAFANGGGGRIIFGVTNDELIVGVDRQTLRKDQDRLSNLVSSWVEPRPAYAFETYPVESRSGRVVLALVVSSGSEPPYGAGRSNEARTCYVRHNARSVPATPTEIRALARSRPPIPHRGGLFG